MAITILTGTPGTPGTDGGGTASVSFTIPSTVPDGSLIIAIHDNDFRDLSNMVAPVLTGFAPTMNLLGVADGGVNLSHIKVWAFDYPTGASGTARTLVCTETGSHDGDKGLSVYALSGAAVAASALDGSLVATMSPLTSVASFVLGGVTTGNAGSVLFAHVRTSNGAGTASITAPGSMTQQYSVNNFTRFAGASEQLAATGATGTRTFTPASSVPYVAVMFAIQPAGSSTVNGTATLTGAGAVSAAVTQRATAAPTGAGTVSALVTQRATAAPSGAGTLAAAVTQQATVAPTGAGTVSALVTQQAAGTLTGTGALVAAVTQQATAAPTGVGAVSAAVTQQATAAPTGVGSLAAGTSSTVNGTATLTGTGALAAAVTQQATAAPAGTGGLTVNSTVSGTATLTGAGTVSAAVTQRATAALASAGSLSAAGPAGTQGFWGVHL